jgi:hypothetical protein
MKPQISVSEVVGYSLLENGLDFIASGVDSISSASDKRALKYGVLHLGAGIELVLKERLRLEDWRQIFSRSEKADERLYEACAFQSVNLEQCLDRLCKLTDVDLDDCACGKLKAYYDRRNRIQHFRFTDSKEAIEAATVDVLGIVLDFVGREFDQSAFTVQETTLIDHVRAGLNDFRRFALERMAAVEPELANWQKEGTDPLQCPSCLQRTLKPDVDVECAFCGYRSDAEGAAILYLGNVLGETLMSAWKDGNDYPLYWCPNCVNNALVGLDSGGFLVFCLRLRIRTRRATTLRVLSWSERSRRICRRHVRRLLLRVRGQGQFLISL